MTDTNHIKKLIAINQRRLQVLEEQKAAMGVLTPPHIVNEIEDTKEEISQLQAQLDGGTGINSEISPVESTKVQNGQYNKQTDKAVFISYAWGGESEKLVNELDQTFQNKGITIIRDKRNLGFKGQIRNFMRQIGRGKAVIIIISKKYLESENCMFELVEIAKNGDFYDRIFPIVLPDANISKPIERIKYIQYWENKIQELDEAMKRVSSGNLQGFRESIDLYIEIRQTIARLTDVIADMNALTPEMHLQSGFDALFQLIEQKIAE